MYSIIRKNILSQPLKKACRLYTTWPMMTEEHRMLSEMCRGFAETELAPKAHEFDQKHMFPAEPIRILGELGIMGICTSSEYGGSQMDSMCYAIAMEEISKVCASTGGIVSVHTLVCSTLGKYANEAQKRKFLEPCASGEAIGCFMLSEPGNGSDAGAASTTALDKGSHYIINGSKAWISNSWEGRYAVVFATTDKSLKHKGISAFIVDMKSPGVLIGKKEDKMGIRGSSTATVTFENCEVPKENLLGEPGYGFKIAMSALDGGRIGIAGQALGIAQGSLECAIAYSKQRTAFNKPISSLYAIQEKLSTMSTKIDAARLLTYLAAQKKDAGLNFTREAAQAKLFASEAATYCSHQAIQVLGGMGYVTDMPAERFYRDARITEIYEGTSEVQHLVIAGNLLKEYP